MINQWSTDPPTRKDMDMSFNGWFWIRYVISEVEQDDEDPEMYWPEIRMIQPIQVMYEVTDTFLNGKDKLVFNLDSKTLYLDDAKSMEGIEWQLIPTPFGVDKDDC